MIRLILNAKDCGNLGIMWDAYIWNYGVERLHVLIIANIQF